jgi:hypothetical protein
MFMGALNMRMQLKQVEQHLQAWKVRSVVMLPEQRGIEVSFSVTAHDLIRFRTKQFGVGRRGAKAAALAKFAACAGFGDAEEIYRFLLDLPSTMTGIIFSQTTSRPHINRSDASTSRRVRSGRAVA